MFPCDLGEIFEVGTTTFAQATFLTHHPEGQHDDHSCKHSGHEQVAHAGAVPDAGLYVSHDVLGGSPAGVVGSAPSSSLTSRPCSLCRMLRTASLMVSISTTPWKTSFESVTIARLYRATTSSLRISL